MAIRESEKNSQVFSTKWSGEFTNNYLIDIAYCQNTFKMYTKEKLTIIITYLILILTSQLKNIFKKFP